VKNVYPESCVNLPMMVDDRQLVIQPAVMGINGFDLLRGMMPYGNYEKSRLIIRQTKRK